MNNWSRRFNHWMFICLIGLVSPLVNAALDIEIFGGGATRIPVAIVPFADEGILQQRVTDVIAADLKRSGLFKLVESRGRSPYAPADVDYQEWVGRGASALVIGETAKLANGNIEITFFLMDIAKRSQMTGLIATVPESKLRAAAHRIADVIYEELTGAVGVFSTRIAYVLKRGKQFSLRVADADGHNASAIFESSEPIISPDWSPDGRQLAYVSFEKKKPVVYVQTLATKTRKIVANFKGSNSAPAWSPDGKKLAVVLTSEGGSQIFLINADGSGHKRLSRSSGIDTEPSFSPDGQSIIFTSDRGGSPQIYRMPVTGNASGAAERLTFEGSYNVSPQFSWDGKQFTFIHRSGNGFNVAVQDMATRQIQLLTKTKLDESPSFAPNDKTILYATEIGGRGILSAVSSDGQTRQQLTEHAGDIREPAWGPLPIK